MRRLRSAPADLATQHLANTAWGYAVLGYPAPEASYRLSQAIGWRRERHAVVADLKRTSPGQKLGEVELVAENLSVQAAVDRALELGGWRDRARV